VGNTNPPVVIILDGVTVFPVASGLDLAAPGTGGVPVGIGKLVVILGRGVNDRGAAGFYDPWREPGWAP
jgi:hypothetical protein